MTLRLGGFGRTLRPTFSASNALGQTRLTPHPSQFGFRAKQMRRPWKMSTWLVRFFFFKQKTAYEMPK